MTTMYGVYGVSGMGREAMPLARQTLTRSGVKIAPRTLVFIDDSPGNAVVNGHAVLTFDEFAAEPGAKLVTIAIADSTIRASLARRCESAGVGFFDVRADNAVILDDDVIGEGSLLCSFSHVTSNARIGKHFHANIYSYVAHDCIVGDFVTLAPAAKINGAVVLEDHVYVGTGAMIKQGAPGRPMVIGHGAIIGMGAVVTKSVPAGVTVVGNPARPVER
jgi:sugar O-acyltransferase (sialic acid O-acetyltransferase NeuD family)